MCIAIVSPGDQKILPIEHFNESMNSNPDGMGVAFVHKGKFHVAKSLRDGKSIYRVYMWAHDKGYNCVLHFRRATHGSVCVENCHPFVHSESEIFVHNGVLSFDGLEDDEVDSQAFSHRILKHMPNNWRELPDIRKMLERYISGSKIVILDIEGNVTYLNEKDGLTVDGRWYSNSSFRSYNTKYTKWWDNDYYFQPHKKHKGWKDTQDKAKKSIGFNDRSDPWDNEKLENDDDAELIDLSNTMSDSDVPKEMRNEVVTDEDPLYDLYPHGFVYQGYELCSFCVPWELVTDVQTVPVWLDDTEDDIVCESCNIWMSKSSPKRYTIPFDKQTELPLYDEVSDWLKETEGQEAVH